MAQQEAELQEDAGGPGFNLVEQLEGPGIAAADLKKLKEAGLHTIEAVAYATRKELGQIKGISDNKVDKILDAAFKTLGSMGFTTATEVSARAPASKALALAPRWALR